MGKGKVWLLFMMILLFLCGAAIFLHPYINGAVVDSTLKWEAQQFIDHITNPTNNSGDVAGEEIINTEPKMPHLELRQATCLPSTRIGFLR